MSVFKIVTSLIAISVAVVLVSCKSNPNALPNAKGHNILSGADKALGWTSLFDGKDLMHWRVYNGVGMEGWQIRDGAMVALGIQGKSADAITIDTFSNFELSIEWKISKGGNSGIFFNVRESDGLDAVYQSGPEYQLVDDDGFSSPLEEWQKTAANYAMHPPEIKNHNPQGSYNHSRLIVDNAHVQHWLNDRLLVRYELWTPEWEHLKQEGKWKDYPSYGMYRSGHIALQDHGNEISFRNIKIRRL